MKHVSILFVCMGNICRSPMAEGVFRKLVDEAGLAEQVTIDSAGTLDAHAGDPPDARAQRAAERRGYDLSRQRGRGFTPEDCSDFDLVLTMDRGNYNRVRAICSGQAGSLSEAGIGYPDSPQDGAQNGAQNVRLFMDFAPSRPEREVPDPYGAREENFEFVMDLIEAGAMGLLDEVRARLDGADLT